MTASRGQGWLLALAATATMSISYVDRQTLAVLAPTVTRALGLSETQYGFLAAAFSIAYLVGAPLAGVLVDRVGARRAMPVAVLAWSLVAALHALVPGFAALFALRIALGLAESPSFPGSAQTMDRVLSPSDRPRGIGLLFTGSSFGAMVAPPLATALALRFGWRAAFVGTSALGLLWIPLWLALSSSRSARAALDTPSLDEHRRPHGPRPPFLSVLTHGATLRAMLLVVAASPVAAFLYLWAAKYLVADFGVGQAAVGHLLWLPPLFLDVGTVGVGDLFARRVARRRGRPDRTILACATIACATIALVPLAPTPLTAVLLLGVAVGGAGGIFSLATADMLLRAPSSVVSSSTGFTAAAQSLAYILVAPVIGACLSHGVPYRVILIAHAAWLVPGMIAWMLWPAPPPRITALPIERAPLASEA